jgi:trafficking protein particle complex subunit 11
LATLHDNQLKTDINNIRNALLKSGYRTKLAIALVGDSITSPLSIAEGVQERVENIRRGTGIDGKTFFYLAPQDSDEELKRVADTVLTALFLQSVEYYRDLGRHARKKRGRGLAPQPTVPPTSGTSQTLSLQGWNVRYDFKAAVFAEFRQEMDAALRSYEQAYEGLMNQELLDIIPSWSPRWNEARLLADVITIRSLRCLAWTNQTTSAVRRWQTHRDRISDFIDRRGRGTNNYGWKAWESRWAVIMAELIQKSEILGLAPSTFTLYLQPEKAVMGERLQPWELLHHPGYWYRAAARHAVARRELAYSMPEEDRRAPNSSPASQVASKAYTYDTYMCPEPHEEYPLEKEGVNHSKLILGYLETARSEYQAREQLRIAAEITLECAKEMANVKSWSEVITTLRPLWEDMSFRAESWEDITEDLSWTLRTAAAHIGVGDLIIAIDWELLNKSKLS